MRIVSPVNSSAHVTLPAHGFGKVVAAMGTDDYGVACIELFEQMLGVDHWALFEYPGASPMSCLATASRTKAIQAQVNVEKFVGYCHGFDPSLRELKQRRPKQPCLVSIEIGDIENREYRKCFEATNVEERLSCFTPTLDKLYQLSVYRGTGRKNFSHTEMTLFATVGQLILSTTLQHQSRSRVVSNAAGPLTIATLQQSLAALPGGLSERECEVCARAVAGITIKGTALDLNIHRTSVITYRQRAYQKLGISSLNELVARLLNVVSNESEVRVVEFKPNGPRRRDAISGHRRH